MLFFSIIVSVIFSNILSSSSSVIGALILAGASFYYSSSCSFLCNFLDLTFLVFVPFFLIFFDFLFLPRIWLLYLLAIELGSNFFLSTNFYPFSLSSAIFYASFISIFSLYEISSAKCIILDRRYFLSLYLFFFNISFFLLFIFWLKDLCSYTLSFIFR